MSCEVSGKFDKYFTEVVEEFRQLFTNKNQHGAALCVQINGQSVIDVYAGVADYETGEPWNEKTIVNLFSCSKPLAAFILAKLSEEGRVDFDALVGSYWSEFAKNGKEEITVRQLLNHSSGLAALYTPFEKEDAYSWQIMVKAVEFAGPLWKPGSKHGYSPYLYGWFTGELIRRITNMTPGNAVKHYLGIDNLYLGLNYTVSGRAAKVTKMKGVSLDDTAKRFQQALLHDKDSITSLAFTNPPGMMLAVNSQHWRELELFSASAHSSASALATLYSNVLSNKLLKDYKVLTNVESCGEDLTLLTNTCWGLGLMLDKCGNNFFGLSDSTFGHHGAGGNIVFADPKSDVSFCFLTNSLSGYILTDPRVKNIVTKLKPLL